MVGEVKVSLTDNSGMVFGFARTSEMPHLYHFYLIIYYKLLIIHVYYAYSILSYYINMVLCLFIYVLAHCELSGTS